MFVKNSINLLLLPVIVLSGGFALLSSGLVLSGPAQGITPYAPYVLALVAAGLGVWFKRVRVLMLALLVASTHWVLQAFSFDVNQHSDEFRIIYAALAVALPVNMMVIGLMRDPALFSSRVLSRVLFVISQFAIAVVVWNAGVEARAGADAVLHLRLFDETFDHWSLLPQPAILLFAIAMLALLTRAFITRSALDGGAFTATAALAMALHGVNAGDTPALMLSIASLALVVSVIQDTYRMAFIDELTGLAQRRALMMDIEAAGGRYAIAMLDVDHFKKFNDTYGHDVGDQVLMLVASRMMRVKGGGKAYRYGGEEFTVLFPGKTTDQALPHLEALRKSIAEARFHLRGENRPPEKPREKQRAAGSTSEKSTAKAATKRRDNASVSVTISIGVTERDSGQPPAEALKVADQALYRAKKAGRNQVAR